MSVGCAATKLWREFLKTDWRGNSHSNHHDGLVFLTHGRVARISSALGLEKLFYGKFKISLLAGKSVRNPSRRFAARSNCYKWKNARDNKGLAGGERGIRTPETVSRLHTFQACAFNHSATSPVRPHGKARQGRALQPSAQQS